jgi:hypothetical protein
LEGLKRVLGPLASLKLTVVLFALSMVLILAGTLAQVHEGVWAVVHQYFRSPFVFIPLHIFVPDRVAHIPEVFTLFKGRLSLPLVLPFPGGLTLGALLFVNLLAAHAVRFKLTPKRTGIIVAHLGALLLLLGEFVTGAAAEEGNMAIDEGDSSNYVEDIRSAELAVIEPGEKDDLVVVVPQWRLVNAKGAIVNGLLRFDVKIDEWMPNSAILGPAQARSMNRPLTDSGLGASLAAVPVAQASGVDGQSADVPSAYITLTKGEKRLGKYLVSAHVTDPQPVTVDGKEYLIQLRFKRTYKPYTVHLIEFKHDVFVGTDKPRNFSSRVRLTDASHNVDREVLIYMNHPLRYQGETFYQASFKPGDGGTVLQVVRNPGWLLPYVSCSLVTLGVLTHFGIRLNASARRVVR